MTYKEFSKILNRFDIPTVTLAGFTGGFIMVGVMFATFGGLIEAGEGQIFSWRAILAGLACLGVAAGIAVIMILYWMFIPRRYGIIKPELTGFGLVLAAMSLFSSIFLAVNFTLWVFKGHTIG